MIVSFRHKGLRELFVSGKSRRVASELASKLLRQMDAVHQAEEPVELNFPGYDLHQLKNDRNGYWALKVNKNWRLTFRFVRGDATELDLEDYH